MVSFAGSSLLRMERFVFRFQVDLHKQAQISTSLPQVQHTVVLNELDLSVFGLVSVSFASFHRFLCSLDDQAYMA